MLATQEWLLANNGDYTELENKFGISSTFNEMDDRVILNYSQIASDKQEKIVRECRGLVLNSYSYEIIAKGFDRFFNLGEAQEITNKFVWDGCTASAKEDGSLILTYMYEGQPHLNTRGSFGYGAINGGDITWRALFELAVPNWKSIVAGCGNNITLVWELCSRYNKVVRDYPTPTAYLLSAFEGENELVSRLVDGIAKSCRVNRPRKHTFVDAEDVANFLEERGGEDPTFEGVVLKDINGLRLKVKSAKYLALHRLKNNGNIAHAKNIIPLILDGETAEICAYFSELEPTIRLYESKLEKLLGEADNIWHCFHDTKKDKDFAAEALTHPFSSLLFKARRNGGHPRDYIASSKELIIKVLS